MNLVRIVQIVNVVWLFSEVALVLYTRRNRSNALPRDRGSRTFLWCVIGAGLAAGTLAQTVSSARIMMPESRLLAISLLLLAGGLAIRWTAILTLGRYFTTRVAVRRDQRLVQRGLYRLVRHPSYSGLLLLFLGMGLSFGNWLSFAVVVIPFMVALSYRIQVEEASLMEVLGTDYVEYCLTTKRLIPGLY